MSTREVFVVTFDPLGGQGGVGGFDWFYDQDKALARYHEYAADPGPPECRVRFWHAFPLTEWDSAQITDYVETTFLDNDPEGQLMTTTYRVPDLDTHPNLRRSILTGTERDRLFELIDLVNDLSVTQIDHHESDELNALWRKLHEGELS